MKIYWLLQKKGTLNFLNYMKPTKIAHVTFDMQIGGAERVILNLVENTDIDRFDITILCIENHLGELGTQLKEKGIKIITFGRNPGFDFKLLKKIRGYIRQNKIEILHCHQYTPYTYGVLASFLLPCDVIFTEHGRFYPDVRKFKRVMINPLLEKITKRITAISSATVSALIKYENFSSQKIDLVYNGLEDSKYNISASRNIKKEFDIPEDVYIIGTVARLDPIKNQKMMFHALKSIKEKIPEIKLLVIGDGPERKSLENLVIELQLQENVVFTGFRNDVHLFYQIMDIFLLTSFSEGTAMTLIEAMASSLPCIVTDVGGNPEVVINNETGIVIPSDRHDLLTTTVCELLWDTAKIKKMGQAGRQRFEQNFTIEKMVDAYQKLYE